MHDPDLQIGVEPPCRIHVEAAQLRFDVWQCLASHGGNLRGDYHERTPGRQPKTPREFAQDPANEDSPLEQRIDQEGTMRCPAEELPFLLVALSGHHPT